MKIKSKLIILLSAVILMISGSVLAEEEIIIPEPSEEYLFPGRIEGTNTYFEIKNSEYLNIILTSNEEIKVILESVPKMISLDIESFQSAFSTDLTINGLELNKTYYKYEDSYKNEAVFISDENGSFSWNQDLSQPHHVWIQETESTVFLPENCSNYGNWDEATQTCILTQDLTQSVEIIMNNVTLDCNGQKIVGNTAGYGIYLNNRSNIAIKNCLITNFSYGIYFNNYSNNNKIIENNISDNGWSGIYLAQSSNNNIISRNNVSKNEDGIVLSCAWCWISNNIITENNVSDNFDSGITLYYAQNNDVIGNYVSDNGISGTYNTGINIYDSLDNKIIENNVLGNKLGIMLRGWAGPGGGGGPCSDNALDRNKIESNEWGLYIFHASNNRFRDNFLLNNKYNFYITGYYSYWPSYYRASEYIQDIDTSNTINGKPIYYLINEQDKIIDENSNAGFVGLVNSKNITIRDLTLENNFDGVLLFNTSDSTIENVNVFKNNTGISLHLSSSNNILKNNAPDNVRGIYLSQSSNNNITENIISNNSIYGLFLFRSSNNNISENNILDNKYYGIYFTGEWFEGSSNNKVYHNNFIRNLSQQVYIDVGAGNLFDDGYPSGGNYWSGYKGVDLYSGANQDQPGSDGIGDTSYPSKIYSLDRYPFMKESGWVTPPEPDKWSFVIITDLHIGWGIPDYAGEGYSFSDEALQDYYINPILKEPGQDYYITDRLRKAIQWINENYRNPDYNIKFVVVDGDVSDTAEYSEFLTTRKILDELKIPYMPVIGNHDIWPYTQKINSGPDGGKLGRITSIQERVQNKAIESLGDEYFETVFWGPNNPNVQRINNLFSDFESQEEKEGFQGAPYFHNYSFTYKEMNFIALDFASRDYTELMSIINTNNHLETIDWFKEKLNDREGEKVIVLTHYPFKILGGFLPLDRKEISDIIRNCNCEVFNFAGHTHINEIGSPGDEYKVIETEPTSQVPLGPTYNINGEFIRVVKISNENNDVNYETLIGGFPSAINPYFTVNPAEISMGQKINFRAYTKNLEPQDILSYNWDFDKNYDAQCVREEEKSSQCTVTYNQPGTYRVTLKVIPKNDLNYSEELYWNIKVNQIAKNPFKIILPIPGIFPLLNGEVDMNLTQQANAQNTMESVLITKITSPAKPIGALNIHFEETTGDINLSNLVADIDLNTKKSILYMSQWPETIEEGKILFIPK